MASVLLALLLCEAALRVLFPKYRDVAQGRLQPDDMRIFATLPNTRDYRVNPATKRRHPFHTNNLGQRQHRNFSDADILAATTVGVFGDSFVRAGYLDAPYVFTEPLDYLLNRDGNFAVLNFGMGDYGPAQSYFTYRSFHAREALDYVLFVYCANDIADLVRNRLFDLDDDGRLRQREAHGAAWWVPFVSRLHLTYLALDASGRLAPHLASAAEELGHYSAYWFSTPPDVPEHRLDHGAEVFRQLIRRWKKEVEESGGRFLVALLPTQPDYPRVRPVLEEAGIGVIDLNACYASRDEEHLQRDWQESPYYLHNDGHWNELGNRLAAACLDERLRREAGLPALAEAARDTALAKYYAAFESPRKEPALERIRGKYQAFGRFDVVYSHAESSPFYKKAVESDYYDVYVDGESFVFASDDCDAEDAPERLLAHATPVDPGILPPDTSYFSLRPHFPPLQEEAVCFARWAMPQFAVSHILVGQRDGAKAVLWSGEIVLDRDAFEKTLAAMLAAAGEPVIASAMDVHVDGRRIFYVSDDCEGTDGRTPFFLHVVPMREADLPPERIEHGYDNLDFQQAGATFGEGCVVRWQLPDYPIRRIRTGQYVRQSVESRDGGDTCSYAMSGRAQPTSAADLAVRFCLVVASVLLALLLCEAALRVLFPKYRGVAEGRLQPDDMRIYASPPNARDWGVHPDTGRGHPFHTNNLGLHQHRDFSDADILSATTVGVFGDSFVRFGTLDAPYAFTEPLDYLLNLDGHFTVLNFGMGGYGPAQSYFHYRSFPRTGRHSTTFYSPTTAETT